MNKSTLLILTLTAAAMLQSPRAVADLIDTVEVIELPVRNLEQDSRDRAELANTAAVDEAVDSIITATRLDLDFRLPGHTSVLIAGNR